MNDNLRAMALLTGIERNNLETNAKCRPDPVQDGAAEPVAQLDGDGMVYFAVESWSQQFAYVLMRDLFLNGPLLGWYERDVLGLLADELADDVA